MQIASEGRVVLHQTASASTARRLRLAVWIALACAIPLGTLAWMIALRGPRIENHDSILIGGWIALSLLLAIVAILLRTTPAGAIKLSLSSSVALILGTTAALHLSALLLLIPALSEDVLRYRLDGRMWLAGASPYSTTPQQFFMTHHPDAIDSALPFPQMHTIYPPTSQAIFAISAAIEKLLPSPTIAPSADNWRQMLLRLPLLRQALVLRSFFALFSIASAWLLVRLLIASGASPWWAIVFAWNPLVILETAGMGHQDILGILPLLISLWMARRQWFGRAAIALALAVGVKPLAIVLLPFLYRDAHEHGDWREGRRMILIFAGCMLLLFLPPMLHNAGYRGWIASAHTFSRQWEANGSIYELLKACFGAGDSGWAMERAKSAGRLLGVTVLLLAGLILWQMRATLAEAGYWLLLVILLVSPVVYPWYLLWILCLVPLLRGRGGWTGLTLGGTVVAAYALWHTPTWIMPGRWLAAEYLPVYAVLALEITALLLQPPLARRDEAVN